jgi:O-antigen ligase
VKWVPFIIILAGLYPLAGWLKNTPKVRSLAWMLVGFLPFVLSNAHLYIAIYSWAEWSGYVKGVEVSVVDALAVAFYFAYPPARDAIPFRYSIALYFLAITLSAFQAQVPIAALFCAWQFARMFLLYAVVTRACNDPRAVSALLTGMIAGLIMEAGVAIWQRFALGVVQASGTMEHQNTLGLISHLIVFPCFALLLTGRREWLLVGGLLAGVIVDILTGSRATLGLAGIGFASVFVLSAYRRWTSRKALVLMIGIVVLAVIAPVAISSIGQRGGASLESSDGERDALIAAAAAIVNDHPLGVGANLFVPTANLGGYYIRSGVSWRSYGAFVHNVYWLVAAELGVAGLACFLIFAFRPVMVALLCGIRFRKDIRGDLLVGLGVGLLMVYLHSSFEWILLTFQPQYFLAISLGLVAGLAQQLGYFRRKELSTASRSAQRSWHQQPLGS